MRPICSGCTEFPLCFIGVILAPDLREVRSLNRAEGLPEYDDCSCNQKATHDPLKRNEAATAAIDPAAHAQCAKNSRAVYQNLQKGGNDRERDYLDGKRPELWLDN